MSRRFRIGGTKDLENLRGRGPRFNGVALQLINLVQKAKLDVALTYSVSLS